MCGLTTIEEHEIRILNVGKGPLIGCLGYFQELEECVQPIGAP